MLDTKVLDLVESKLKGFNKKDYEVIESVELGIGEAYNDDEIKDLGLENNDYIMSYSLQNQSDQNDLYTAEFDNEELLTIHKIDIVNGNGPKTVYKK